MCLAPDRSSEMPGDRSQPLRVWLNIDQDGPPGHGLLVRASAGQHAPKSVSRRGEPQRKNSSRWKRSVGLITPQLAAPLPAVSCFVDFLRNTAKEKAF
jgi:hypothetical protein